MTQLVSEAAIEPRTASFALPATRQSARLARRLTEVVLETWACPVDGEIAVLLVSELFTNALLYGVALCSPEDRITLELLESPVVLHVEVHDPDQGSHDGVAMRLVAGNSETGRGLELVDALSTNWGCRSTPSGKCVYFDMALSVAEDLEASAEATALAYPVPVDLARARPGVLT